MKDVVRRTTYVISASAHTAQYAIRGQAEQASCSCDPDHHVQVIGMRTCRHAEHENTQSAIKAFPLL